MIKSDKQDALVFAGCRYADCRERFAVCVFLNHYTAEKSLFLKTKLFKYLSWYN
ncbi:MAG TPA: hypothetical protein PK466_06805 [Thermotogota bacterium]|nr:hypothetical protein [Thermotogota bacterium]